MMLKIVLRLDLRIDAVLFLLGATDNALEQITKDTSHYYRSNHFSMWSSYNTN